MSSLQGEDVEFGKSHNRGCVMTRDVQISNRVTRSTTRRNFPIPNSVRVAMQFVTTSTAAILLLVSSGLHSPDAAIAKAVAETPHLSQITKAPLNAPLAAPESAARLMEGAVRVADGGFFDPYSTSVKSRHSAKKYYKAPKPKKADKPEYSLGYTKSYSKYAKQYKGYDSYSDQYDDYDEIDQYRARKYKSYQNASTYRTMCVRIKDGYYWPINFAQKKYRLKKDDAKCQKSCEGEVRLYYYPSTGDINEMRDMKGRRYKDLQSAYLYRTEYVKDAQCKPRPWSEAAKAKHQTYAANDAEKKRLMHIRLMKRAEKQRVASLNRLAKKVAAKRGQRYAAKKLRSRNKKKYAIRRKYNYQNQYSANY